jgi:hypothetical protein
MTPNQPAPPIVWVSWCRNCGAAGIADRSQRGARLHLSCAICPWSAGVTMGVAKFALVPRARKGKR